MEELIDSDKESPKENDYNSDEGNLKGNEWKINYIEEKTFWKEVVLKKFVYSPNLCPNCKWKSFRILEKQTEDIIINFI